MPHLEARLRRNSVGSTVDERLSSLSIEVRQVAGTKGMFLQHLAGSKAAQPRYPSFPQESSSEPKDMGTLICIEASD